jgi:hypothetical protein
VRELHAAAKRVAATKPSVATPLTHNDQLSQGLGTQSAIGSSWASCSVLIESVQELNRKNNEVPPRPAPNLLLNNKIKIKLK